MRRNTLLVILLLTVIATFLGWNYVAHPFAQLAMPTPEASPMPSPEPVAVRSGFGTWLQTASSKEKIAQLIAYPIVLSSDTDVASISAEITDVHPGLVTWFGSGVSMASVSAVRQTILQSYALTYPKPLFAVDHEGGKVQRLSGPGFSKIPSWSEMCGQTASESASVWQKEAGELNTAGVDIVFGPMVDMASSSAVLGSRICDNDPQIVVDRASAMAQVLENAMIMPVFKHFPGIGKTTRDLHRIFDRVTVTPEDALLYRTLLQAFPTAGAMISHVGVLNQFPDLPCSLSSSCVGQVTANFPTVVVFSDALEMAAAAYQPDGSLLPLPEVAQRAVIAGNHVLVFGPTVTAEQLREVVDSLSLAYDSNVTVKERVDAALRQLDRVKTGKVGYVQP